MLLKADLTLFFLTFLGAFLSLTRLLIDYFKRSKSEEKSGNCLRNWNFWWFIMELVLCVALIYLPCFSCTEAVPKSMQSLLCFIAFWRINEVAYAFYNDGMSKIKGELATSDLEPYERINMLFRSANGLIVQFAVLYAFLTPLEGFRVSIHDFGSALYFSATTMTSIGQEGQEVQTALMRIFHFYQSALGILLFVLAISVYVSPQQSRVE